MNCAQKILLFAATQLIGHAVVAQRTFIKSYGGSDFEQGAGVVATRDGGYFICGHSASFDASGASVYLLKVDSAGNHLFSKTYGGSAFDIPTSMASTYDGGFAISGITWSFGAGDADAFLLKTDSAGNLEWMKTLGTTSRDKPFGMVQTADSGFALTGFVKYDETSAAVDDKIFLIKTDPHGTLQWHKIYGGALSEEASSLIQTSDGGFAITGFTGSFGAGQNDFYTIKTDSMGNVEWAKTFGTSLNEVANDILQTADSGYLVLGTCETCGFGDGDMLLMRLEKTGELVWSKCLGTEFAEGAAQFAQLPDGNLLIAGISGRYSSTDIVLSQVDEYGNFLFSKIWRSEGEQSVQGIALASGSHVMITGATNSDAEPFDNLLLIGFFTTFDIACFREQYVLQVQQVQLSPTDAVQFYAKNFLEGAQVPVVFITTTSTHDFCMMNPAVVQDESGCSLFPNPFSDYLVVQQFSTEPFKLEIFDLMGKTALEKTARSGEVIPFGELNTKGFFFYQISFASGSMKKGILLRK